MRATASAPPITAATSAGTASGARAAGGGCRPRAGWRGWPAPRARPRVRRPRQGSDVGQRPDAASRRGRRERAAGRWRVGACRIGRRQTGGCAPGRPPGCDPASSGSRLVALVRAPRVLTHGVIVSTQDRRAGEGAARAPPGRRRAGDRTGRRRRARRPTARYPVNGRTGACGPRAVAADAGSPLPGAAREPGACRPRRRRGSRLRRPRRRRPDRPARRPARASGAAAAHRAARRAGAAGRSSVRRWSARPSSADCSELDGSRCRGAAHGLQQPPLLLGRGPAASRRPPGAGRRPSRTPAGRSRSTYALTSDPRWLPCGRSPPPRGHRVPGATRPMLNPRRAGREEVVVRAGSGARCARASRSWARPRWIRERTVPSLMSRVAAISS